MRSERETIAKIAGIAKESKLENLGRIAVIAGIAVIGKPPFPVPRATPAIPEISNEAPKEGMKNLARTKDSYCKNVFYSL
jgi:hypothetical protein